MSRLLGALMLAVVSAGCAMLRTDATVPAKPLPASFAGGDDGGADVGQTTWREWLGDRHLNVLVAEGLSNNQDLLIALQRIETGRAGVEAASGDLLPQVALGLGAGIRKFGLYTMDGAGNASTDITPGRVVPVNLPNFTVGLQSSWEVDLWGRLRSQRRAAVARYLGSIEGTNLVLTSLVADVASSYFDLLALDHVREVLRLYAAQQQEAVEVVRLQKMAGRATELAVQQFEAQLADTRALERASLQQTTEAENRINVMLGRYPQVVPRDAEVLCDAPAAALSAGVPSDLLANRPDIREAEQEVRATKLDVKAARAAFLPTLTITAGAGYEAFNPRFLFRTPKSIAYSFGSGLVAPVVNRKALEAQFIGAQAEQIQAMYEYQRRILVAYTEVANALSNVRAVEDVLAARRAQKDALEQTIATADALYRAGKASYLEVLVAQQNSIRSQLDFVEACRGRRVANVVLYKALGGGWR